MLLSAGYINLGVTGIQRVYKAIRLDIWRVRIEKGQELQNSEPERRIRTDKGS